MRFLIQKIDKEIRHDFSFTLLESIRYQRWLQQNDANISIKYINCKANDGIWFFNAYHEHYVPVGSVEFVLSWMKRFGVPTPKPMNVPKELLIPSCAKRPIVNGNHMDFEHVIGGKYFVKSNTEIKGYREVIELDAPAPLPVPAGEYQVSEYIPILSEWRVFVYQGKMVGLQNYSGDFTVFPTVSEIQYMISKFKSAPVAYTLDVGKNAYDTFVIECHDFFSCGLYGFADHNIYPYMLYRWFHEYLNKNK